MSAVIVPIHVHDAIARLIDGLAEKYGADKIDPLREKIREDFLHWYDDGNLIPSADDVIMDFEEGENE